jgi:hypothetical protein
MSPTGDRVYCVKVCAQMNCRHVEYFDNGTCAAAENKPSFVLISKIHRVVSRRRQKRGLLTLFLPAPANRRRIFEIEANGRYALESVEVSGFRTTKAFMNNR